MKRIIRILSVLIVAAAPLLLTSSASAASASMSLNPASATVAIGATFSVDVYEDSGSQDVNAAKANLTYNAAILDYISVTSSPAFSIDAATSGGSGTVNIERGALPAVTGSQLVATITFKGRAAGATAVNFTGSSSVLAASGAQANKNILTSTSGGNYTVPAPVTPPPPTPPPTPNPTPSPTPSPAPTPSPSTKPKSPNPSPAPAPTPSPAKDTTPPVITNITVSDIGTNSALITWYTSEPATSQIDYGITTNYELTNGNGLYVTTHKLSLNYKLLNPDTEFHYKVKSVDSSGNIATSPDQTFTTKAGNAILDIKVVDQNNKSIEGAKVTIGDVSGKTDKNGHITLSDLPVGKVSATVDYKGQKTVKSIQINAPTGTAQNVTLTIKPSRNYAPIIIFPTLGLLALVAGAFFLNGGFKSSKPSFLTPGPSEEEVVIGGGAGTTTSPNGSVTPPEKVATPEAAPSGSGKTELGSFDPSREPPPPTIVRPTIPPRS